MPPASFAVCKKKDSRGSDPRLVIRRGQRPVADAVCSLAQFFDHPSRALGRRRATVNSLLLEGLGHQGVVVSPDHSDQMGIHGRHDLSDPSHRIAVDLVESIGHLVVKRCRCVFGAGALAQLETGSFHGGTNLLKSSSQLRAHLRNDEIHATLGARTVREHREVCGIHLKRREARRVLCLHVQ